MTPDQIRYCIFDNDPTAILIVNLTLQELGYESLGSAETVATSIQILQELAKNQTAPGIVFIDGNFTKRRDGAEGKHIATKTRELFPDSVIIAMSLDNQPWSDLPEISKRDGFDGLIAAALNYYANRG